MALERISNLDVGAPPIPPLSLIEVSVAVGSPPSSYASRQFTVAELFTYLPLTEDGTGGLILDNPAGATTETYFGVTNGSVTTYVGSIDGSWGYVSAFGGPLLLTSDVFLVGIDASLVYSATDGSGIIPDSQTFGWAMGNNYLGCSEVDFWSTVNLPHTTDVAFAWIAKTGASTTEALATLWGDGAFSGYSVQLDSGENTYIYTDASLGSIGTGTAIPLSIEVNSVAAILIGTDGSARFYGDIIQTPSASVTPANNGDLMVQATSNTSLTFKYKGSDGTVRSASLTLA